MFTSPGSRVGRSYEPYTRLPIEVQTANGSGNNANATCTFKKPLRPGNLLLFLVGGHTSGISFTAGLTQLSGGASSNNQQVQAYIRRIQAGDPLSWAFFESFDIVSAFGVELQDASNVKIASVINTSLGSTSSVLPVSSLTNLGAPGIIYGMIEEDNNPTTIAAAAGWSMRAIPSVANHPIYIFNRLTPYTPGDPYSLTPCYTATGQPAAGTGTLACCVNGHIY